MLHGRRTVAQHSVLWLAIPRRFFLPIDLALIENETRVRALQFRERRPEQIGQITRHRYVESNAWVHAGTRVPTKAVWSFHTSGHNLERILTTYPSLTPADVSSAINFEEQRQQSRSPYEAGGKGASDRPLATRSCS